MMLVVYVTYVCAPRSELQAGRNDRPRQHRLGQLAIGATRSSASGHRCGTNHGMLLQVSNLTDTQPHGTLGPKLGPQGSL